MAESMRWVVVRLLVWQPQGQPHDGTTNPATGRRAIQQTGKSPRAVPWGVCWWAAASWAGGMPLGRVPQSPCACMAMGGAADSTIESKRHSPLLHFSAMRRLDWHPVRRVAGLLVALTALAGCIDDSSLGSAPSPPSSAMWDFVVVGGGVAGCIAAGTSNISELRLTFDRKHLLNLRRYPVCIGAKDAAT